MNNNAIYIKVDRRLAALLPRFLANCRRDVERMRGAVQSGDLAVARSLGHKLMGAGGFFGFHEASSLGREIERAARDGDTRAAASLIEQLDRYLAQVRPQFD